MAVQLCIFYTSPVDGVSVKVLKGTVFVLSFFFCHCQGCLSSTSVLFLKKLEIAHWIPASHRKWNGSVKWILGDPVPEAVKAFSSRWAYLSLGPTDRYLSKAAVSDPL